MKYKNREKDYLKEVIYFLTQVEIMKELAHRNIVKFYDYFVDFGPQAQEQDETSDSTPKASRNY